MPKETTPNFPQKPDDPVYLKMVEYFGNDPNIERIEPAEDFDLPDPIRIILPRFNLSDERQAERTRHYISDLFDFVSLPYLLDNFESPQSRETWREQLFREQGQEAWDAYNENALRPAAQSWINGNISRLKREFISDNNPTEWTDRFHQLADKIIDYRKSIDKYLTLPKHEQVEFIRQIKTDVVELLWHLASLDDLLTEKSQIHPDIESHVSGSLGTVNSTIWALSEPEVNGHEKKSLLGHKEAQFPALRAYVRDGFLKPEALVLFDIDPEGETDNEEYYLNDLYTQLSQQSSS